MKSEQDIIQAVYSAKGDSEAADRLVRQYLPFIKSETAAYIHRAPMEGQDEELSVAMLAFHEAVLSYRKEKGAFIPFASVAIRNRLTDYYRREKRHQGILSLDRENREGERDRTLLEHLDGGKDEIDEHIGCMAAKEEIMKYAGELADYGLSLTDIADACPRQERTLRACHRALNYAKEHKELLRSLTEKKKLPVAALASGAGVERKTLERHRNYMVAILVAYTNGFEIIRGHLRQMDPERGGRRS